MPIIENAVKCPDPGLELVIIEVDRYSLQKCRWRRRAEDGVDFAFCLLEPLSDGDVVFVTGEKRYQVSQLPEPVLTIPFPEDRAAIARLTWAIGNLHQPVDVRGDCLLVGDDPMVKRVLAGMGIAFQSEFEIFCPPVHSAINHHTHEAGMEYDHQHFIFGHGSSSPF
jgi:urease accessory protein